MTATPNFIGKWTEQQQLADEQHPDADRWIVVGGQLVPNKQQQQQHQTSVISTRGSVRFASHYIVW
jgi:hypothetical protein